MDLVRKDKIYHGFKITIRIFRINLRNMQSNSDTLVTVLNASLIHEIHIAQTLLNSYGIRSFIFDENLMSTIGTAFVEGYKLKVNSADFKKAKEILETLEEESY